MFRRRFDIPITAITSLLGPMTHLLNHRSQSQLTVLIILGLKVVGLAWDPLQ